MFLRWAILGFFLHNAVAQSPVNLDNSTVPAARLARLDKGVSLSNWYWNRADEVQVEGYIQDVDIERLKSYGVRHVRIPVEMKDIDNEKFAKSLQQSIDRLVKANFAVVVSAFGTYFNDDLVPTEKYQDRLALLCKILRDTSPKDVFIQIANEPSVDDPNEWTRIQGDMIALTRKNLPEHTILTSTPLKFGKGEDDWNQQKAFSQMKPSTDGNVVYTLYFYEPFYFTHQGAEWDENASFVNGLGYPSEAKNSQEVIDKLDGKAPKWMVDKLKIQWDKKKLEEALAPVVEWREKYKRPVMFSEFGVYKRLSPLESRKVWIRDALSLFEKHSIPWTYWDYAGNFGTTSLNTGFREEDPWVREVLFPRSK